MSERRVRVELPTHLRTLASLSGPEVSVRVAEGERVTPSMILDSLEAAFPMLRGTVRDQTTGERRAFLRFFACGADYSMEGMDCELPNAIADGREAFLIVGAVAGG